MLDRELLQHPALGQGPDYERGFIDGMQHQMQSSVSNAVTRMIQPEQEPVAWAYSEGLAALKAGKCWTAYGTKQDKDNSIPLYTAPQQREWQRLTDDEIDAIDKSIPDGTDFKAAKRVFARAIEDKLKEKNARND